ncbi:MAG: hypothetical protein M3R41_11100, partial [Pseudomonadota bacterium]|nr:hypothetical protein [Pseudomonadota bacterium]
PYGIKDERIRHRILGAMLAGEIDRDTALARALLGTRQYAKRQYTWFRRQPPANWKRVDLSRSNIDDDIVERLFRL